MGRWVRYSEGRRNRMHVKFVDVDGDVHVAPVDSVWLDSDVEGEPKLSVTVSYGPEHGCSEFDVTKEEFERLARLLLAPRGQAGG